METEIIFILTRHAGIYDVGFCDGLEKIYRGHLQLVGMTKKCQRYF